MGDLDSEAEAFMDIVRQRASSSRLLLRESSNALAALGNSLRSTIDAATEGTRALQQPAPVAEGESQEGGATEGSAGASGSEQAAAPQNPPETPMEVDQPGEFVIPITPLCVCMCVMLLCGLVFVIVSSLSVMSFYKCT